VGGEPNAPVFAAEYGTSSVLPSIATSSRPNAVAPGVPGPDSGPASRANNSSNGRGPSRRRALASAGAPGTCHPARPVTSSIQQATLRAASR
jgi:hypothetical protein